MSAEIYFCYCRTNSLNFVLKECDNLIQIMLESQFSILALIGSSNPTLSGYPACQIIYTYDFEGIDLKNLQIWTIANNMVYILTCDGTTKEFDNSLSIIQNMIDSFKITEIQ
jgi:hypothetical protein